MLTVLSILLGLVCSLIDNVEFTLNYVSSFFLEMITGGWVPHFKHCIVYQPASPQLLSPLVPVPSFLESNLNMNGSNGAIATFSTTEKVTGSLGSKHARNLSSSNTTSKPIFSVDESDIDQEESNRSKSGNKSDSKSDIKGDNNRDNKISSNDLNDRKTQKSRVYNFMNSRLQDPSVVPYVLITGCSSGIGFQAAMTLSGLGYHVFAGLRKAEDVRNLFLPGSANNRFGLIHPIHLDVTERASIEKAVKHVCNELEYQKSDQNDNDNSNGNDNGNNENDNYAGNKKRLVALINNSGIPCNLPVECTREDLYREVIDVNIMGTVRTTQAFLPLLRGDVVDSEGKGVTKASSPSSSSPSSRTIIQTPNSLFAFLRETCNLNDFKRFIKDTFSPFTSQIQGRKKGKKARVIVIGSVGGFLSLPGIGPYASTKFALKALVNSLRVELIPFGISVSLIEPGMIFTKIQAKMLAMQNREISRLDPYLYGLYHKHIVRNVQTSHIVSQIAVGPENTNRAITHAVTNPYPMTRYLVGIDARIISVLASIVPNPIFDVIFYYLGF